MNEVPLTYQEIDRDQVDVRTVFPLVGPSVLNENLTLEFDFDLERGVVYVDPSQGIDLEFKIKRLNLFDHELATGFAYAPEGTTLVAMSGESFKIQNLNPRFNQSTPLSVFVIVRDYTLCVEKKSEQECAITDPTGGNVVKEDFDRLIRLKISSR